MTNRGVFGGGDVEVPEPGVVASFPLPDGGVPFQVGYDENGVWCGRPGLSTVCHDATVAENVLDAYQRALDGHWTNHTLPAEVIPLNQPRS